MVNEFPFRFDREELRHIGLTGNCRGHLSYSCADFEDAAADEWAKFGGESGTIVSRFGKGGEFKIAVGFRGHYRKRLYFKMQRSALKQSCQLIFLPSA